MYARFVILKIFVVVLLCQGRLPQIEKVFKDYKPSIHLWPSQDVAALKKSY